jgi:Transglycosylase SLT domain
MRPPERDEEKWNPVFLIDRATTAEPEQDEVSFGHHPAIACPTFVTSDFAVRHASAPDRHMIQRLCWRLKGLGRASGYGYFLALASPLMFPAIVHSVEDPSSLCLRAAADAASQTGVPNDVLLAIALVETGRDGQPWPWTVNAGGDGRWFDTPEEAEAHVAEILAEGVTNVDLGCFQLNYRWHAAAFTSIADMLDPDRNATYAAEFLAEHFAQSGDWTNAAAAYHSATPEYAEAYRTKFETAYAGLGDRPEAAVPPDRARLNRFPLLVAGANGRNGSLVPTTAGGLPLIGGP